MEFDIEIYNSQRPIDLADTSNLSSFDKIDGQPSAKRHEMHLCVFSDGTSEIEILEKVPTNPISILHQTLPATEPVVAKTIISGNTANYYDSSNVLLYSESTIPDDYSALIKMATDLTNNLPSQPPSLNEMIDTLEAHGYTVTTLQNDFLSISKLNTATSETTDVLFDTSIMRAVGVALLDSNNKVTIRTFYKYVPNTNDVKIEEMTVISFITSPTSNVKMADITNFHFHSFDIINNL